MSQYVETNRVVEEHPECILRVTVQDANGVAVANLPVRVTVGNPPTFTADPQKTNATGLMEFVATSGAMPENRDYFVTLLDAQTKQPLSAPIRFSYKQGQTLWYLSTVRPAGAPTNGGQIPPEPQLQLDPRLASLVNVAVQFANVANGQQYWKLIAAQFQDGNESGGNRSIVSFVQNELGQADASARIVYEFGGEQDKETLDSNGHRDFPMTGDSNFDPNKGQHGPYTAYIDGAPSDQVVGMGLPLKQHVQYLLTWRKVTKGAGGDANPPNEEQGALDAALARKATWMPINTDAALYKFAQQKNLGYPQTDEFSYLFNGVKYIAQVFNLGIVYVKDGDFGNVKFVKKPAGV